MRLLGVGRVHDDLTGPEARRCTVHRARGLVRRPVHAPDAGAPKQPAKQLRLGLAPHGLKRGELLHARSIALAVMRVLARVRQRRRLRAHRRSAPASASKRFLQCALQKYTVAPSWTLRCAVALRSTVIPQTGSFAPRRSVSATSPAATKRKTMFSARRVVPRDRALRDRLDRRPVRRHEAERAEDAVDDQRRGDHRRRT